ncbi:MAG: hypothetical protein KOO63_14310 [Bacteroidales bacterium]|nr:hypothetical protein [Candidatus Latescibacterota bacterium]
MLSLKIPIIVVCVVVLAGSVSGCTKTVEEISRPEKVQSLRIISYDRETYVDLARRWKEYYDVFPSEDAYGNWMSAARYAKDPDYRELLDKGLSRYPANPVLLFLSGILCHGAVDNTEGMQYLERAVAMDPSYIDPWFALVIHYMQRDDMEEMDVALRHLIERNAISDVVMDFSFNMLAGLHDNAILITNGDNDTYPGWILTRLMNYRPDVQIVNRSLLNAEWYPLKVIREGVPRFITSDELNELRADTEPPFSDTLIVRLVKAAEREKRPVYFAATLGSSQALDPIRRSGIILGLATLVSESTLSLSDEINQIAKIWIDEYRTVGLDGWGIKYATEGHSDKWMAYNYAASLSQMIESLEVHAPKYRLDLFHWYCDHIADITPQQHYDFMNLMWCRFSDIPEIDSWCRKKGYFE